jgi:hypothetical protein
LLKKNGIISGQGYRLESHLRSGVVADFRRMPGIRTDIDDRESSAIIPFGGLTDINVPQGGDLDTSRPIIPAQVKGSGQDGSRGRGNIDDVHAIGSYRMFRVLRVFIGTKGIFSPEGNIHDLESERTVCRPINGLTRFETS